MEQFTTAEFATHTRIVGSFMGMAKAPAAGFFVEEHRFFTRTGDVGTGTTALCDPHHTIIKLTIALPRSCTG